MALLGDSEVVSVKVHPAIKGYIDKRGAAALYGMLKAVPDLDKRDQLIGRIPASAYARTQGPDIADILSLVARPARLSELPKLAWRRLAVADAERALRQLVAADLKPTAAALLQLWTANRRGPELTGKDHLGLLKALPQSGDRNAAILRIPGSAYAKMDGADVADILRLISQDSEATFDQLPKEPWARISRDDLEGLMIRLIKADAKASARTVIRRWTAAHRGRIGEEGSSGDDLRALLAMLPPGDTRDALIEAIPGDDFSRMSGAEAAKILSMVSTDEPAKILGQIAPQAWLKVGAEDAEWLIKQWLRADQTSTAVEALRRWAGAPRSEAAQVRRENLKRFLALLPNSSWRNAAAADVAAAAYEGLDSAGIADLLLLLADGRDDKRVARLQKLPKAAWEKLDRQDALRLIQRYLAADYSSAAAAVLQLWIDGHAVAFFQHEAPGQEILPLLKALPESRAHDVNQAILKIAPLTWTKMASAEAAGVLSLLRKNDEDNPADIVAKLPAQAWLSLSRQDLEGVLKPWAAGEYKRTATTAAALWLTARQAKLGEAELTGRQIHDLLKLLPASEQLDDAIAAIPGSAYAKMDGADVADILWLVTGGGIERRDIYKKLPVEAWKKMGRSHAATLIKHWLESTNYKECAQTVLSYWMDAHRDELGQANATGQELVELIKLVPSSYERNATVFKIPGPAWGKMRGGDAAALLWLVLVRNRYDEPAKAYASLAKEAWQKLGYEDAQWLMKLWLTSESSGVAATVLRAWLDAHQAQLGAEVSGQQLNDLLKLLAKPDLRDIVTKIPGPALLKMKSAELSDLFALLADYNSGYPKDFLQQLPKEAWQKMEPDDLERLMRRMKEARDSPIAALSLELWTSAHQADEWPPLAAKLLTLVGLVDDPGQKDALALKIPGAAYAQVAGRELARFVLGHVSWGNFAQLPAEAWKAMALGDAQWIVEQTGLHPNVISEIVKLWLGANGGRIGEAGVGAPELLALIAKVPYQGDVDALLQKIPLAAWAKLASADIAALLRRTASATVWDNVPQAVWLKMRLRDVSDHLGLLARWKAARKDGSAASATSGKDYYEILKVLRPSADRDEMILKVPGVTYAEMESADIVKILLLLGSDQPDADPTPAYLKVPEEAWYRIERQDMEALLKHWTDKDKDAAAKAILELWMRAHQDRIVLQDTEALLTAWADKNRDGAAKAILELWMKTRQ